MKYHPPPLSLSLSDHVCGPMLLLLLVEDFARFFTGADDEVMSDVRATCQGHHCFTRQPTPVLHTHQYWLLTSLSLSPSVQPATDDYAVHRSVLFVAILPTPFSFNNSISIFSIFFMLSIDKRTLVSEAHQQPLWILKHQCMSWICNTYILKYQHKA